MEHNRLLNLWRDVVSVKRVFAEMKSTTERDLSKLNSEISSTTREMNSVCSGIANMVKQTSKTEVSSLYRGSMCLICVRGDLVTHSDIS
jgi:rootletin